MFAHHVYPQYRVHSRELSSCAYARYNGECSTAISLKTAPTFHVGHKQDLWWVVGFRVRVLGSSVYGLRGSSIKDPTPEHDKWSTSSMPKILTPATFF